MAVRVDPPNLNGRNEAEKIKNLETWAAKLTNLLNYSLNHLDDTNFVEAPISEKELTERLDNLYLELRSYIVSMIRGKG